MNTSFKWLIVAIALVPLIYLGANWSSLPDSVPLHFDLRGEPDRFGSRNELLVMVLLLSAMSAGTYFLIANIYKIDPRRYAAANRERLERIGFFVGIFLAAVCCFIVYSTVKGNVRLGMRYILAGVGILFCLMGNYMHTLKPNYFAGIRVPWTLNNEENWRRTHLLAGKLWFGGGLLTAIFCLILPSIPSLVLFFAVMLILVVVPIAYSYRLYRRGEDLPGTPSV